MECAAIESGGGRDQIGAWEGVALLGFGASWCEHCNAAKPLIAEVLARHPEIRFVWVEDGKGKPLGRSFQVRLWPTLVFLRDGKERERLVRPVDSKLIEAALIRVAAAE